MDDELVDVALLGVPLAIQRMASEHQDDLKREFALIARQADSDPGSVPARLLRLTHDLTEQFQSFSAAQTAQMEEAKERGDSEIDLYFRFPPSVEPAVRQLADLLAEADAYCLTGKDLLTLVAPGTVVSFRNWVVEEIVRQVNGSKPRSWSEATGY